MHRNRCWGSQWRIGLSDLKVKYLKLNLNLKVGLRWAKIPVAEIERVGSERNRYRPWALKMMRYLVLKLGFGCVCREDDEENLQHTGGCDCQAIGVSKPLNSWPFSFLSLRFSSLRFPNPSLRFSSLLFALLGYVLRYDFSAPLTLNFAF